MRFEKNRKQYILKNKDTPVLTFDYEKTTEKTIFGDFPRYKIKHIKILEPDLLPVGYPTTNDPNKLKKWIERRKIPKNRINSQRVLNLGLIKYGLDINNFMNYIDISYGLSLNDSYWIIPVDKKLYWKDYNLYKNKFSEIVSLVAFGEKMTNEIGDIKTSPEYTTNGMLAKCWTVLNDEIVLLKKSSEHHKKEAFAEYYMCQIAEIMGFEHIEYDIIKYHENIVSSCPLFTTEDIGFVPMYYCMKQEDTFKEGARLLEAVTKIYGKEKIEDLMLFDSLIYNTDRHLGNFGMLVDNNTREILKPAPIFDNGNSILAFLKEETAVETIFKQYTSKFNIDFDILSNLSVQERHREGLEKLKTFKFKKHPEFNLEDSILEKAEDFIQKRANFISNQLNNKLERNFFK